MVQAGPDLMKRFGDMIFNCFFGYSHEASNFFMGFHLITAKLKYLPAFWRETIDNFINL